MTLTKFALLLTTILLPAQALARPTDSLPSSITSASLRACERQPACLGTLFANLLSAPAVGPRELRIDSVVVFDRGSDRLASHGSRISQLADSWKTDGRWLTITVEGYADTRARNAAERLELGQKRADKIKLDLVANGVDPAFIIAVGRDTRSESGRHVDLTIAMENDAPRIDAATRLDL